MKIAASISDETRSKARKYLGLSEVSRNRRKPRMVTPVTLAIVVAGIFAIVALIALGISLALPK